jgi:protein TonB
MRSRIRAWAWALGLVALLAGEARADDPKAVTPSPAPSAGQVSEQAPAVASAAAALASDSLTRRVTGFYFSDTYPQDICTISSPAAGILRIRCLRFSSIGFFDGQEFSGVWRHDTTTVARTPTGAPAWLRLVPVGPDSVAMVRWVGPSPTDVAREIWTRTAQAPSAPVTRVEDMPEAITKVQPVYPEAARRAGIEGTVIVSALVDKDGRVLETKIMKSVPALDAAAVEAVKHWIFKPALADGQPVRVWVMLPISFHLK